MSRVTQWYVAEQLSRMGWPRSKGVFRKESYVDARVLDEVVENAIHISVGLGAGRPQLAVAVLADTFGNNPWTKESTAELLKGLREGGRAIENDPESPPWTTLYVEHRISLYGNDVPWKQFLGDIRIQSLWASLSARAIVWGLTHEKDMPGVFAKAKAGYERTAAEAIPHGLDVSARYPWDSLEHFYEACEDLVRGFESVRPPLRQVPAALRTASEVARRLRT